MNKELWSDDYTYDEIEKIHEYGTAVVVYNLYEDICVLKEQLAESKPLAKKDIEYIANSLTDEGIGYKPQWISVKDRLPDDDRFLGAIQDDDTGCFYIHSCLWVDRYFDNQILHYGEGECIFMDKIGDSGFSQLTHWQLLPEPPKGE